MELSQEWSGPEDISLAGEMSTEATVTASPIYVVE